MGLPMRKAIFAGILLLVSAGEGRAFNKFPLQIPMSDSVLLAADLYQPGFTKGPWPVILVRSVYGTLSDAEDRALLLLVDLFDYALVVQTLRGRHGSGGADSLFFSDGWNGHRDGYDTVEWIARQPWCNGKIGMWGASGLGISAYLAAGAAPPYLSCSVVLVAASDLYSDALFYGGVYQAGLVDDWFHDVNADSLLPFFIDHPGRELLYERVNLLSRCDSVNVPILHISGWHDIFIQGVLNAFTGIQASGGPNAAGRQKLIVGPWTHDLLKSRVGDIAYPSSSFEDCIQPMIDWFNVYLKDGDPALIQTPVVKYYLMGPQDAARPGNRWIESDSWPPPSEITAFYLRGNSWLSVDPPETGEDPDVFDADPGNAVPTAGGRNLSLPAGPRDQAALESRPDVLVYSTAPLTDSLVVTGRIRVRLHASSDAPDTDFSAKLCDVYPDGRSMLVADGIVQARYRHSPDREELLSPGSIDTFEIDLWSVAQAFAPGHRIRLDISSSNSPRFEANPNTGEPFRKHTHTRTARQTVYHDADRASCLLLPVLNGSTGAVTSQGGGLPLKKALGRNFPNPFNSETRIPIDLSSLPARGRDALLKIFDSNGRLVRQESGGDLLGQGGGFVWDGRDAVGRELPSGVYLCRLACGSHAESQRLVLIR
jgi:predicted acyl esterase